MLETRVQRWRRDLVVESRRANSINRLGYWFSITGRFISKRHWGIGECAWNTFSRQAKKQLWNKDWKRGMMWNNNHEKEIGKNQKGPSYLLPECEVTLVQTLVRDSRVNPPSKEDRWRLILIATEAIAEAGIVLLVPAAGWRSLSTAVASSVNWGLAISLSGHSRAAKAIGLLVPSPSSSRAYSRSVIRDDNGGE